MRRRAWVGFAGFCLLSGSAWLRQIVLPSAWPELLQIAVHDGVVCIATGVVCVAGRDPWPGWRRMFEAGCWAAVLFVATPLLASGAAGHVEGSTGVLVLALVPALTVFLETQCGRLEGQGLDLLLPALAGLGGLALLVPFRAPSAAVGWVWLAGLCAGSMLLAVTGVRLWTLMRGLPVLPVVLLGSGVAGLLAVAGWRVSKPGPISADGLAAELLWGLIVDGTLAVLTVWLGRELTPTAFSTRFVLVPWVTLLGGLAVAQARPGWFSMLGLLVALAGSVAMVRADGADA